MVIHHPEIEESEIDPLIVLERGEGSAVADCRIILDPDGRGSE
jgi:hypothetical protein